MEKNYEDLIYKTKDECVEFLEAHSYYKPLIYKDKEEEEKFIEDCLDEYLEFNHMTVTSKEEREKIKNTHNHSDFEWYFITSQCYRLFTLVYDKIGKKYWSSDIWSKDDCRVGCPFGELCDRQFISIDEQYYCYGQLILKKELGTDELLDSVAAGKRFKIVDHDSTVRFDSKGAGLDICEIRFNNYILEHDFYLNYFGDASCIRDKEGELRYVIIGGNSISQYYNAL